MVIVRKHLRGVTPFYKEEAKRQGYSWLEAASGLNQAT